MNLKFEQTVSWVFQGDQQKNETGKSSLFLLREGSVKTDYSKKFIISRYLLCLVLNSLNIISTCLKTSTTQDDNRNNCKFFLIYSAYYTHNSCQKSMSKNEWILFSTSYDFHAFVEFYFVITTVSPRVFSPRKNILNLIFKWIVSKNFRSGPFLKILCFKDTSEKIPHPFFSSTVCTLIFKHPLLSFPR